MSRIFGILNLDPGSFSDGALNSCEPDYACRRAQELLAEGADVIDIGAETTRPGAPCLDEAEEMRRILPVLHELKRRESGCVVSIDTRKSSVAEACLSEGASIINDVSGFTFDAAMPSVVAKHKASVVIMHMRGVPSTMQNAENLVYDDVVSDVLSFLVNAAADAVSCGVSRERIIIDPGVGFSKTVEQNLELIRSAEKFVSSGFEVLYGISRKSFIGRICSIEVPAERDAATNVLHAYLADSGVHYLRTHNVKMTRQTLKIADALKKTDFFGKNLFLSE